MIEHRMSLKIDTLDTALDGAVTQAVVLDVQEMKAGPRVLAALLRRAADDLDPSERPHRPPGPTFRGSPGSLSVTPGGEVE